MTESQFPKLPIPPVQEIVLGIGYKNYLESPDLDRIRALFEDEFSENSPVFEMNFTKEFTEHQRQIIGLAFVNSARTESLIIDKNRVTFIDRTAYQGFDVFYDKFLKIFQKINKFKTIKEPIDIGLKVVNKFFIDFDEITSKPPKISFLPPLSLNYDKKDFAGCVRTGGQYLLRDITSDNLRSVVSVELQVLGIPPRFQALFITDTTVAIKQVNETILKEHVRKLQDFKNRIFFANISKDIKYFNK